MRCSSAMGSSTRAEIILMEWGLDSDAAIDSNRLQLTPGPTPNVRQASGKHWMGETQEVEVKGPSEESERNLNVGTGHRQGSVNQGCDCGECGQSVWIL